MQGVVGRASLLAFTPTLPDYVFDPRIDEQPTEADLTLHITYPLTTTTTNMTSASTTMTLTPSVASNIHRCFAHF
jgi:hypothetical protein